MRIKNQADDDFEYHDKDKTRKHVLVQKLGTLDVINDVIKNITNLVSFPHMAGDFTIGKPGSILY